MARPGAAKPQPESKPYLGTATDAMRARAILDAMPPDGELYWHGKDGRPCPCSSCCFAAMRMFSQPEPESEKQVRRTRPAARGRLQGVLR